MKRNVVAITLIAFLALTAIAVAQHSYWGIFEPQLRNFAGLQVLIDLVIALSLFLVWMWKDAKSAGRSPWPSTLLIFATGSIGALIYLLVYKTTRA